MILRDWIWILKMSTAKEVSILILLDDSERSQGPNRAWRPSKVSILILLDDSERYFHSVWNQWVMEVSILILLDDSERYYETWNSRRFGKGVSILILLDDSERSRQNVDEVLPPIRFNPYSVG